MLGHYRPATTTMECRSTKLEDTLQNDISKKQSDGKLETDGSSWGPIDDPAKVLRRSPDSGGSLFLTGQGSIVSRKCGSCEELLSVLSSMQERFRPFRIQTQNRAVASHFHLIAITEATIRAKADRDPTLIWRTDTILFPGRFF